MSEDRYKARCELRRQRDEELSIHRQFPLLTLAEWEARERRARLPMQVGCVPFLFLSLGPFFVLGILPFSSPWREIILVPTLFAGFGAWIASLFWLSRHFGLSCPYCRTAFTPHHNRSALERVRHYESRGRCPRCQRMIFTDWALEPGWAETDPELRRRKALEPRWYSASTWIALAVVGAWVALILWVGHFLFAVTYVGAEYYLLFLAPAITLVLVGAVLYWRVAIRKERRLLAWTAVRYAVIILGISCFVVFAKAVESNPKGGLERFAQGMKSQADLAGLRSWADSYRPPESNEGSPSGKGYPVPPDNWPECVRKLEPTRVRYQADQKSLVLVFHGRFTFWTVTFAPRGVKPEKDLPLLDDGIWVGP